MEGNRGLHLTPDQIERQPFRTRRRGYDAVQVRNFLREIAKEMRDRQKARDDVGTDADPSVRARGEAEQIVTHARSEAEQIVAEAEARAEEGDLDASRVRAGAIIAEAGRDADSIRAEARDEAAQLLEQAETAARERSDVVLRETQARLDALLEQEREVNRRLQSAGGLSTIIDPAAVDTPGPREATSDAAAEQPVDGSLAEFVKTTVRNELGD